MEYKGHEYFDEGPFESWKANEEDQVVGEVLRFLGRVEGNRADIREICWLLQENVPEEELEEVLYGDTGEYPVSEEALEEGLTDLLEDELGLAVVYRDGTVEPTAVLGNTVLESANGLDFQEKIYSRTQCV